MCALQKFAYELSIPGIDTCHRDYDEMHQYIYKIKMHHRQNIITVQTQTPGIPSSALFFILFIVQVISIHMNCNSINIAVQSILLLR